MSARKVTLNHPCERNACINYGPNNSFQMKYLKNVTSLKCEVTPVELVNVNVFTNNTKQHCVELKVPLVFPGEHFPLRSLL